MAALTVGFGYLAGMSKPEDAQIVRRDMEDQTSDEYDMLAALLAAEVRTDKSNITMSEALRRGWWDRRGDDMVFSPSSGLDTMKNVAKHNGMQMNPDGELAIALNYTPTANLLKGTIHANTSIEKYMSNLPGVRRHVSAAGKRSRMRFGEGGLQRPALIVPLDILDDVGLV